MKNVMILLLLVSAFVLGCGTQSKASQTSGFNVLSEDDIGTVKVYRIQDSNTHERFVLVADVNGRNSITQVK